MGFPAHELKISNTKKRLFEKILFTIDKIDESEKTMLLGKVFKHLIVGNINLVQYFRISRVIENMMLDEINYFFYSHGYYKHNDDTRKKYYNYMELVGEQNLKSIMIKNDLYEIKDELTYQENRGPQQYMINKKEGLTNFGMLFCEFGFESRFYLKVPIE